MVETKAQARLKSLRRGSNVAQIENMLASMKAEVYKLLTNYMYLSIENLSVYIDITASGEYILNVKAESNRLINMGKSL